ncbi:MAG: metal ABC transporter solute-binding protein, Zn/Mn family [Fusobacterium sp.]|uniref:metal ABC transporter solute-binding protein, Zn/Mn family n=1 Tax=Fusobacterium sp. TaxID=68766 RepID=UPI003F9F50BC
MKKILLLMFLTLNVLAMAEEKLKIGITLLPYYSFVANIVKDRAEVIPIVKAEGFDSHTYQPKVEDIERASKVDAIVVNGVGHDEFVYKIIDAVDKKKKPIVINANKDVPLMPVAGTLGNEKIMDSHTFISITAAIQQVHNITKELIKLDPKNKDFYLANSREYVKKLRKLKTDALKEVQDVNGTDVRVATFLGGYNYLLSEFGIDVKAVLEPTHGSQISMSSLQKMIEKIEKEKIDIIFGEKNYSDEYVSIIKNETGIEVRKLEHLTTGAYRADSFEKFIKVDLDEVVSAIKYVKNKNKIKK